MRPRTRNCLCCDTRTRCCAGSSRGLCGTVGGSAMVRGAVVADPPVPVGERVPGDARDAARMAPQADRSEVGLQQAPGQARETADRASGEGAGAAAGQGESAVGLPTDPGRTHPAGTPGRLDDGLGIPHSGGHRSSPAPGRPDVARVPDRAGRVHHRLRLPIRRPDRPAPRVRAGVPRARHTPTAHRRA